MDDTGDTGVMRPHHTALRFIVTTLAITIALALARSALPAGGAPPASSSETQGESPVSLSTTSTSVPTDGGFEFIAEVDLDRPATYLESRLQIFNPGGRLLFQKTEVRNEEPPGTVRFTYSRALTDLALTPGVYPVELRVRSDSGEISEWVLNDRLLVYDREAPAAPLVLVVHVSASPLHDPLGRFVIDPGQVDRARAQTEGVARLVLGNPSVRVSLALPPMIAEEWARIASGYETSGPEGVSTVDPAEPVPRRYADTLGVLRDAIATGRLELMAMPFASPDIAGLVTSGRTGDLSAHYERGMSALVASLETSPSGTAVLAENLVLAPTLPYLRARGFERVVVAPASLADTNTPAVSGVHALSDNPATATPFALLTHDQAEAALGAASVPGIEDAVFARAISEDRDVPVVISVTIGPGKQTDFEHLISCIEELDDLPWLTLITAGEAPEPGAESTPLDLALSASTDGPEDYFAEISRARAQAVALVTATGPDDPDSRLAADASLIAQSRAWAGPDGRWSSADRGLGFAAAAQRVSDQILNTITISSQDITLSSARGDIPVSITSASDKTLSLVVRVETDGVALTGESTIPISVRQQDNFFTVPVDLESSLSGALNLTVYAGEIPLDTFRVTVRSSYLDRLAIVGGVAAVLVGLLLYIRNRARKSDALGTIEAGTDRKGA